MAVDEVLLHDAVANGTATLRFYQWSEPTLSLGYFQSYAERERHAASRDCPVVRRPSGGGAILHDRELTYSLALPPGHSLTRRPADLYDAVHRAFIGAILGALPRNTEHSRLHIRGATSQAGTLEPFLCFQRESAGDVVLDAAKGARPAFTWKVLGSAQRRHRGAILQHGSLLFRQSPAAPELRGLDDVPGFEVDPDGLAAAVSQELARCLNFRLVLQPLSPDLQSNAADLANRKYLASSWTKRR